MPVAARGTRRRVTFDPLNEYWPIWSPDGTRIAYSSDRSGPGELYARRADGTGDEAVLLRTPDAESASDWSADGRYLFYEASPASDTTRTDLWVLDVTSGQPRRLTSTPFEEWGTRISPDGKWITYSSDESGRRETYVTSFPAPGERHRHRWRCG